MDFARIHRRTGITCFRAVQLFLSEHAGTIDDMVHTLGFCRSTVENNVQILRKMHSPLVVNFISLKNKGQPYVVVEAPIEVPKEVVLADLVTKAINSRSDLERAWQ